MVPCFRVRGQILSVLERIGPEVDSIYVVDDACPEGSGQLVREEVRDSRVRVIVNAANQGVGGATLTGYRRAAEDGAEIIVKIDGDGQMEPRLLPRFVKPIAAGLADYTKGNRFYQIEGVQSMPPLRRVGNLALSFLNKLSSGYWQLFDPTNGYTAIHASVVRLLPFEKLSRGYFFESDLLFRLYLLGAVVTDIPMAAHYGNERTGLRELWVVPEFLLKHLRNLVKRIAYVYYLRDFTIASVELLVGLLFLLFGALFGVAHWTLSAVRGVPASAGTVMLAALPILLGAQLLLAFLSFDVGRRETVPRHVKESVAPADPPLPDAPANGIAS